MPEFAPFYRREIEEEGGELLETLMLGIVLLPFVEERTALARSARRNQRIRRREDSTERAARAEADLLERVFQCLERGLAKGNHSLQESILVSFIEDMETHARSGRTSVEDSVYLRSLFGPNMRSGMVAIERYLDQPWWRDRTQPYEFIHWDPVPQDER